MCAKRDFHRHTQTCTALISLCKFVVQMVQKDWGKKKENHINGSECVFIAPTRQIRGHEHWVKSIHSDGALTSPWLCASESRSRLLRFHSRLFQNESCEFHTFNHPSSIGYCSGAIPWWVISLGQYSTTHRHNTCNNQHACMTATHLLHS